MYPARDEGYQCQRAVFRILHTPCSIRDGTQTAYILLLMGASISKPDVSLSLCLFDVHFSRYGSVHHILLLNYK